MEMIAEMLKKHGLRLQPAVALLLVLSLLTVGFAAYKAIYPEAGKSTVSGGGAVIDKTHAELGYIRVKYESGKKAIKVRVVKDKTTLTYDITPGKDYTVIPLQLGSGSYKVTVYKQASGKKYTEQMSTTVKAKLEDELAPFLCPNQYVWYEKGGAVVKKAAELCKSCKTDTEKFSKIQEYIKRNIVYDYIAAMSVKSGYLPNTETTFKTNKGICFDFSALMCAMLRSQGVPAKLVIGYADKTYHAWINVYLDGEWKQYDPTFASTGAKVKSYTTERWY